MKCSLGISSFLEEISSLSYLLFFFHSLHCSLKNVNVWQKPLQYCKVISLQLIKINGKKIKKIKCASNLTIKKKKGFLISPCYCLELCIQLDIYRVEHSVQFNRSVKSDSLQPHEPQHTRPPGPSQLALVVKNLPASAGDIGDADWIPGLGRSPRGGNGKPLQYSCLENSMDRGSWWAAVHGITESRTRLSTHISHTLNQNMFFRKVMFSARYWMRFNIH